MDKLLKSFLIGFCGILCVTLEAANLVEVYQDALSHDPKFKSAKAEWLANRESLAIVRADFFPSITAGTGFTRNQQSSGLGYSGPILGKQYVSSFQWSVGLNQPLIDFVTLNKYFANEANVKAAYLTFLAAESDLLYRVAEAYLTVLSTEDILIYNKANLEATKKLLDQAKRKYEVGMVAITDFEEAQARYDAALANEIEAQNQVFIAKENLWSLTGKQYDSLDYLVDHFPLVAPQPVTMESWVVRAKAQNFDLKAASFGAQAAKKSIWTVKAQHLPRIEANLSYTDGISHSRDLGKIDGTDIWSSGHVSKFREKGWAGKVAANVNLFSGGRVLAETKRAEYLYEQATAKQEEVFRQVVSNTRAVFLTINSYIDKVQADFQALRSAKSSLKSTQASYSVGRRTMADVLNQQAELYNRQSALSKDEYSYIINSLKLKQLVGSLTVQDLEQINQWLTSSQVKRKKHLDLEDKLVEQTNKNE